MHSSHPTCVDAYNLWAGTYDAVDNPLIAQATETLAARSSLFPGARVLELGCGTGRNAATVLGFGAAKYVGVDASPGMLAVARGINDPRVAWIESDLLHGVARATMNDARFEVVVICLVLEHCDLISPVISTAASALAESGNLLVIELHPSMHDDGIGANFRVGEHEIRLPSFRHDRSEFEAACLAANVKLVSLADVSPTAASLAKSTKLRRYAERPVLLELVAQR